MAGELALEKTNGTELAIPTPMRLIELAVEKGADPDTLVKLFDLQLRYEANEARKAYISALQAFKANPPAINKTKKVTFPNKDGSETSYSHALLDVVNDIVQPALKLHGLTATWRTGADAAGRVIVTCVLTHELGHCEDIASLSGPADTSGGKNNVQAIGSTVTYLQRYTLFGGLGLVAKGADDDGKSGEGMGEDAITDWCIQMQDAQLIDELKESFAKAYTIAKKLGDKEATKRLIKVYEQRKRELA